MATHDNETLLQASRMMMKAYATGLMGKLVENIRMDTDSLYLDDSEPPGLISDSSESECESDSDSEPPACLSGTDSDSDSDNE